MMGNITDDGLVARFLVAHCERCGDGAERAPNRIAIGNYEYLIKALVDLKPKGETKTFVFSEQAQKYRLAVRDLTQTIQVLPDTSDALKAHLNKWEAAFCRLALVYHLIEEAAAGKQPDREISKQTAKMATTLMTEFLLPNSIRFYTETIDDGSQSKHARWVAGYILAESLQTIKKRDLQTFQLFVRRRKGDSYQACGPVTIEKAEGEKPMSIEWKLEDASPDSAVSRIQHSSRAIEAIDASSSLLEGTYASKRRQG